jgi:hypothetical protein
LRRLPQALPLLSPRPQAVSASGKERNHKGTGHIDASSLPVQWITQVEAHARTTDPLDHPLPHQQLRPTNAYVATDRIKEIILPPPKPWPTFFFYCPVKFNPFLLDDRKITDVRIICARCVYVISM